jgi:hypothetical protein
MESCVFPQVKSEGLLACEIEHGGLGRGGELSGDGVLELDVSHSYSKYRVVCDIE